MNFKKRGITLLFSVSAGLLLGSIFTSINVNAEEGKSMSEIINADKLKRNNDSFDFNIKLGDIESQILDYFSKNNISMNAENPNFSTYLTEIVDDQTNPIHNEAFFEYVKEFAYIYDNRIGSIQASDGSNTNEINIARLELLAKSFADIKNENVNNILTSEAGGKLIKPQTRRNKTLNVANASSYARKFALDRNLNFPNYRADCTNFASQILYYGNVEPSSAVNASGHSWLFTGGGTLAWYNAHQFLNYWSAEGKPVAGFSTAAGVKGAAREGYFLGYQSKKTYEVHHIAYVNKKVGNKIYISQHITDRRDYDWDALAGTVLSSDSVLVLKF